MMIFVDYVRNRWLILSIVLISFWVIDGGYVGHEFGLYLLFREMIPPLSSGTNNYGIVVVFCHFYLSFALGCLYIFHVQDRLWKMKNQSGLRFANVYSGVNAIKLISNLIPITLIPFFISSFFYCHEVTRPTSELVRFALIGCVFSTIFTILLLYAIRNVFLEVLIFYATIDRKLYFSKKIRLAVSTDILLRIGGTLSEVFSKTLCAENGILLIIVGIQLLLMDVSFAAYAIVFLLFLAIFVHMCFQILPYQLKPVPVFCIVILLWNAHSSEYKYRFPGFDYSSPRELHAIQAGDDVYNFMPAPGGNGSARNLVVISASGGGYRSTFWTAAVLDRLEQLEHERRLPGFTRSVRLVSGASGGGVALSYYVISMLRGNHTGVTESILADLSRNQGMDSNATRSSSYIWADSLSPVTRQFVSDILHLFSSGIQRKERGLVLEEQWKSLDVTFDRLNESELKWEIPYIIFSPVLIEKGAPLLVTNIESKFFGISEENYHIFDIFPGLRKEFRLSTAARMSASFPIVSPAIDLPTLPPVRVTDAGFFDNQGTYWIGKLLRRSVNSILANYDQLIWIEISAFGNRRHLANTACEEIGKTHPNSRLAKAFGWLTAPFETLLNVRENGMPLRSESDFSSLRTILENIARNSGKDFKVRRFKFSNASNSDLTWLLRDKDISCAQNEILHNQGTFEELVATW